MKSNLWIVGRGVWARKIQSSVNQVSFLNLRSVNIVSAHEFPFLAPKIQQEDIVWFATQPQIQLTLLNELYEHVECKVIIEKPYAVSEVDYNLLLQLDIQHSEIFFSAPWMYTTLWQFFKDNIVKNDIIGIEGQRLGNIIRSYCDPVEDRIPHDLYLLRDLFGDKILENLTIERNSTHPKLRASLASGDSKIGIDLGFDDLEVSFWEVSTLDVMTTLDFRSHSYRERNLTKSFAQDQKIALPRMLEAFLGFKPETCRNQALIHCLRNLFYYPISRNSL